MNQISRTITGLVFIIIGFILLVLGVFTNFITWIYAIPLFIMGFFIFLNKKEDKIEERKDLNKIKTKR
jgi:uncharacterized membrane protein YbaN (DUF454 family)